MKPLKHITPYERKRFEESLERERSVDRTNWHSKAIADHDRYIKYLIDCLKAKEWTDLEQFEQDQLHRLYYWGKPTKSDVKPSYRRPKKVKQTKVTRRRKGIRKSQKSNRCIK